MPRRLGASTSRMGASRISGSSRAGAGAGAVAGVVYHKGKVATPQSLAVAKAHDASHVGKRFSQPSKSQMSAAGHSTGSNDNVVDRLSSGFSRSGLSAHSHDSVTHSDDEDAYDLASPLIDDAGDDDADMDAFDFEHARQELTEEELNEDVPIMLNETETHTLFHVAGIMVMKDTAEEAAVLERNKRYDEFAAQHGKAADVYNNRHAQTFNHALKSKEVMAAPPATRDLGVTATTWEIYDAQLEDEAANGDAEEETHLKKNQKDNMTLLERQVDEIVMASLAGSDCLLDAEGMVAIGPAESDQPRKPRPSQRRGKYNSGSRSQLAPTASRSRVTQGSVASSSSKESNRGSRSSVGNSSAANNGAPSSGGGAENWGEAKEGRDVMVARESSRVLSSRALLMSLRTVERAIQQNSYNSRHRLYRAIPGAEMDLHKIEAPKEEERAQVSLADVMGAATKKASNAPAKERLVPLWSYRCPLTNGRNVSCMVWNKANQDLLAVSYGEFDFDNQTDGLIAFWSMKNPEYPECVLRTPAGVTTLDFSIDHPNLLAAGLYNGTICIYDVRKAMAGETDTPAMASEPLSGHTDAVWQVKWVVQGERGERLVSISTDGKVKVWSMKKGLTCTDLMELKRVHNTLAAPESKSDGVISRVASGLCIDFPENDTSVYFAGTEDGVVHKCSVSYTEQDLDTYSAHAGPVNKFRCSQFLPHACLTCSADWTVKLWDMRSNDQKPPITFQTTDVNDVVNDVAWCPARSTLFASATADGYVQVWDAFVLNPLINLRVYHDPSAEDGAGEGKRPDTAGSDDDVPAGKRQGPPKKLSTVVFAENAPVLVTGDDRGQVDVYRILGVDLTPASKDEECENIARALDPEAAAKMQKQK